MSSEEQRSADELVSEARIELFQMDVRPSRNTKTVVLMQNEDGSVRTVRWNFPKAEAITLMKLTVESLERSI